MMCTQLTCHFKMYNSIICISFILISDEKFLEWIISSIYIYAIMQPPLILPLFLLTQLMCISGTSFLSQKNNEKIPSEGFDEAHISQTNPEHTIIFMIRLFFFSLYFWIWYKNISFECFPPHRVLFKNSLSLLLQNHINIIFCVFFCPSFRLLVVFG